MKEAHKQIAQLLFILSPLIGQSGALTYVRKQFIEESPPIRTIVDISHRQCLKECQLRTDCMTISYKRRASYCRLHADTDPLSDYNHNGPKPWNEPILGDYYEVSYLQNQIDLGDCTYTTCAQGYTCANDDRHRCEKKEYEQPLTGNHTKVDGNMFEVEAKIKKTCVSPYLPTTFKRFILSECQTDGEWDNLNVLCSCGPPVHVEHASVENEVTSLNATVTYKCNYGYIENGSSPNSTCLINGTWTGPSISCSPVDCGMFNMINNSRVISSGGTTFGHTVEYICENGTVPNNASRIATCSGTGQWTPVINLASISATSDRKCILADQLKEVRLSPGSNIGRKNVGIVFYPRENVLYNVTDAQKYCESHGTGIANLDDVEHAYSLGYNMETCGWIKEGDGVVLLHYETTSYNETGIIECRYTPTLILPGGVFCKEILSENITVIN